MRGRCCPPLSLCFAGRGGGLSFVVEGFSVGFALSFLSSVLEPLVADDFDELRHGVAALCGDVLQSLVEIGSEGFEDRWTGGFGLDRERCAVHVVFSLQSGCFDGRVARRWGLSTGLFRSRGRERGRPLMQKLPGIRERGHPARGVCSCTFLEHGSPPRRSTLGAGASAPRPSVDGLCSVLEVAFRLGHAVALPWLPAELAACAGIPAPTALRRGPARARIARLARGSRGRTGPDWCQANYYGSVCCFTSDVCWSDVLGC